MQGAFAFRFKPLRRIGRASRVVNNPSRGSAHIVSNPESANKRDAEISQRRANIFENVMKYTYVYKTSDGAYHENLLPQKNFAD